METRERQRATGFLSGSPAPTQEERTWGMLAHLSALLPMLIGVPLVGPLLVMLIKGKESAWVNAQAKEALNFQITVTGLVWLGGLLSLTLIGACVGLPLMGVAGLAGLVLGIVGAVKANNGEMYRYPATWRLIR